MSLRRSSRIREKKESLSETNPADLTTTQLQIKLEPDEICDNNNSDKEDLKTVQKQVKVEIIDICDNSDFENANLTANQRQIQSKVTDACDDSDPFDKSDSQSSNGTTASDVESSNESDSESDIEQFAIDYADQIIGKMKMASTKCDNTSKTIKSNTNVMSQDSVDDLPTSIDVSGIDLEGYIDVKGTAEEKDRKKLLDLFTENDTILKKSVITPDFETKHSVPVPKSKRALIKMRREERKKTTGEGWFHMKAPELTEEVKRDLDIMQMRSVLDPKRFYKDNDRKAPPKYFQVGRIMDNPADFYSSRIPKKQRKATLADELLADENFNEYRKKRYSEIKANEPSRKSRKRSKQKI